MIDVRFIFVIQHPRSYALEVANERSELPDSELYLEIMREYVKESVMTLINVEVTFLLCYYIAKIICYFRPVLAVTAFLLNRNVTTTFLNERYYKHYLLDTRPHISFF